jgi:formylglycine-generating enzyme required for sulfatase activity
MPCKVFISYRRDDAKWQAREVYRALGEVLPRGHVFMDIDSIPPGADFVDVLEGWVEQCDILLALIGPGWAEATEPRSGRRRLESDADFVRIEVRKALARGIPVVPVLLDGAPIPDADRLPEDLKRLVRRNAEYIEHRTVDADVERLIRKLGLAADAAATPSAGARRRTDGRFRIDAPVIQGAPDGWLMPGAGRLEWFRDDLAGPEMVIVPAGRFLMGSPPGEPQREGRHPGSESPLAAVTFARPFAVGRHAVTRGEFAAFIADSGHKMEAGAAIWNGNTWRIDEAGSWRAPGFHQDDRHPVVCVSWDDALAYAAWLSARTGKPYRLPSEAEREYVARAGTASPFWWGSTITPREANYDGNAVYGGGGARGEWRRATLAAGSFAANPWGLHDVCGNVWEWCEDVWHESHSGAPADGTARRQGPDSSRRVVRGGSWNDDPESLRSAARIWIYNFNRHNLLGFRLVRQLEA